MSSRSFRVPAGGSFAVSAILSAGAAVFLVLAWDTPVAGRVPAETAR